MAPATPKVIRVPPKPSTKCEGRLQIARFGHHPQISPTKTSYVATFTNTLVNGQPALTMPYPFPTDLTVKGVQDFRVNAVVNYQDPYVQQWNFNLQRQLPGDMLLTIAYVGTKGVKLRDEIDLNQARPGAGTVA